MKPMTRFSRFQFSLSLSLALGPVESFRLKVDREGALGNISLRCIVWSSLV